MNLLTLFLIILVAYLIGSVSFARLVTKRVSPEANISQIVQPWHDSDLVFYDDAVSASSVMVNVGLQYGVLTAALDILKAMIPTLLLRILMPGEPYYLIFAAMVVVGHNWPVYYQFRGGRGESTIYGGMLAISPLGVFACLLASMFFGWLFGQVRIIRWGSILLMIPWLWFTTGDAATVSYILFANLLFWFTMRNEVKQHFEFQQKGAFHNQEDVSHFMDMGKDLGRFLDQYSLPVLLGLRK